MEEPGCLGLPVWPQVHSTRGVTCRYLGPQLSSGEAREPAAPSGWGLTDHRAQGRSQGPSAQVLGHDHIIGRRCPQGASPMAPWRPAPWRGRPSSCRPGLSLLKAVVTPRPAAREAPPRQEPRLPGRRETGTVETKPKSFSEAPSGLSRPWEGEACAGEQTPLWLSREAP